MFSDKDNEGNGKINKLDKSGFVRVPLMRYILIVFFAKCIYSGIHFQC